MSGLKWNPLLNVPLELTEIIGGVSFIAKGVQELRESPWRHAKRTTFYYCYYYYYYYYYCYCSICYFSCNEHRLANTERMWFSQGSILLRDCTFHFSSFLPLSPSLSLPQRSILEPCGCMVWWIISLPFHVSEGEESSSIR